MPSNDFVSSLPGVLAKKTPASVDGVTCAQDDVIISEITNEAVGKSFECFIIPVLSNVKSYLRNGQKITSTCIIS